MSVPHLVIRVNNDSAGDTSPPAERERSAAPLSVTHSNHSAQSMSGASSASPPSNVNGHLNGGTPRAKRDEEDEVDELRDDEPPAPAPPRSAPPATVASSAPVPSPKPATSGSKSRKSSCDLCHHRKIKVSMASTTFVAISVS